MNSLATADSNAQQSLELLGQIASKTNSEVVLFAIAVGVMGAIFITIFFFGQRQVRRHELEQQKQRDEREGKLLDVMSETASALKGLKTVMENSTTQGASSIARIHKRIDDAAANISKINSDVAVLLKTVAKKPQFTATTKGKKW